MRCVMLAICIAFVGLSVGEPAAAGGLQRPLASIAISLFPANASCAPTSQIPVTSFRNTVGCIDAEANVTITGGNAAGSFRWMDPSGAEFTSTNLTIASSKVTGGLPVSGHKAATLLGRWTVQLVIASAVITSASFTLAAGTAPPPTSAPGSAGISFSFTSLAVRGGHGQTGALKVGQTAVVTSQYTVKNAQGVVTMSVTKGYLVCNGASCKRAKPAQDRFDTSNGSHTYTYSFGISKGYSRLRITIALKIGAISRHRSVDLQVNQ